VKCKSLKSYFQSNLPGKFEHIRPLRLGSRGICRTCLTPSPDVFGPPLFQQFAGIIQPMCQVLEAFARYVRPQNRTYSIKPYLTPTKSLDQTYPVRSSGSRGNFWIYPVTRPDMFDPSGLTRVKSRHQTYSVLRLGSSNIFQTYPVSLMDIFGSLTPQQLNSFWML
jgi:hypothetical protein